MSRHETRSREIADGRTCHWMKSGVVCYKLCPKNHNCDACHFDQMMRDRLSGVVGSTPVAASRR